VREKERVLKMGAKCNRFVRQVTATQAAQIIERTKDKPVLVRFFAQWCGACKESLPHVQEAANEVCDEAEVIMVDGDNPFNRAWAEQQNIEAFPTVVAFRNGAAMAKLEGGQDTAGYVDFFKKWTKPTGE